MDEDSQARAQLNLLRADGHDVVAIGELEKNGVTLAGDFHVLNHWRCTARITARPVTIPRDKYVLLATVASSIL